MIIGFTGSRTQPTDAQVYWLRETFRDLQIDVLHHGACVGADRLAHDLAIAHGVPVVVHTPVNQMFLDRECLQEHSLVTVLQEKPYLTRNRDIVAVCDGLIALPNTPQPANQYAPNGGTWYTVSYAHRLNKQVVICHPDGRVVKLDNAKPKGRK